jgi:hypothetical protein
MAGCAREFRLWVPFIFLSGTIAAVLTWGASRGFDFTDEGTYYLSFAHPEEVPDVHTSYHLIGRVIFAIAAHNIVATRLLTALLIFLSAAIFIQGLRRWELAFGHPADVGSWLPAIGAATAAALGLGFATSPVAPSYNHLNAILLYAASGLILACASEDTLTPDSRRRFFLFATLTGLLVAVEFFVKFSTSVLLAAAGGSFLLLASRVSALRKLQLMGLTALAAIVAAALFFLCVQDFSGWLDRSAGLRSALTSNTFLDSYFGRYWREFSSELLAMLWLYEPVLDAVAAVAGFLFLLRWWPRVQRWFGAIAGAALIGALATFAWFTHAFTSGGAARNEFYVATLAVVGLAFGLSLIVVKRNEWQPISPLLSVRTVLLAVFFLLLPVFGAIGTTNVITTNLFYQIGPGFVVIVLCLRGLDRCWHGAWATSLGTILLCAVALGQFNHGFIEIPYRLPAGLQAQTEPTAIGSPVSTLRLDPASHEFIDAARTQLTQFGFRPGDDLFAFFNFPGFVFAMGGVSPGHPWYFAGDEISLEDDARRLTTVTLARRQRAFIVINGKVDEFLSRLKTAGINFPADYEHCGPALENPLTHETVEIWCPRVRLAPISR